MKKMNNKGFLLLETLVVTTFTVAVLTYLYIQYVSLKKNYNKSFSYNTVPGLLHAKAIDTFFNDSTFYTNIIFDLTTGSNKYIELASNNICNTSYFSSKQTLCNNLINDAKVKTIIITKTDLSQTINVLKTNNPYSNDLLKYIKSIKIPVENAKYVLVFEYSDKTFANILIREAA